MVNIDKIYHLIAGMIITLAIGIIDPIVGFIASVVAGLVKEVIYDKLMKKGTFEWMDFAFTCIGGGLAFVLILTVWYWIGCLI